MRHMSSSLTSPRSLGIAIGIVACNTTIQPNNVVTDASTPDGSDASADPLVLQNTCESWMAAQRATDIRKLVPASNEKMRSDMLTAGGGVRKLGDTYYAMWFPKSWYSATVRRVMFTLHGTHGAPEFEWNDWKDHFTRRTWGFVGLNYLIDETAGDAGYLEPDAIYKHLKEILDEMKVPCAVDSAAISMMGWSRGSIQGLRTLIVDHADRKLLLGHLANSAAWGSNDDALPAELVTIRASGNTNALAGLNYWMYCGEQDTDENGVSKCAGMAHAQEFLSSYGAHIETLYRNPGPGADHHSLPVTQDAVDKALTYFESLR